MRVFAIGDLHLGFLCDKPMDIFGAAWDGHVARLESAWRETVAGDDLVLIPGDISWAMQLRDAQADIDFIGRLPGQKILLRGNHDYWWSSLTQVRRALPPSIRAIQNDAVTAGGVSIGGTRLWSIPGTGTEAADRKIYEREIGRLRLSLGAMPEGTTRIAMLHFPPLDEAHMDTPATALLEEAGVSIAVYAHLHGRAHRNAFNGEHNGVRYVLAAADYLQFRPVQLL